MKVILATLSLLLFSTSFSQETNETVDINGTTRSYVQYLPTGFDPVTESLPVVFCLHGLGDVATNMANIGYNQMGDTARFIAIYPQGLDNSFGQSSWANGTSFLSSTADDISFFHQLIDDVILNQNADPTRIYATGFSMGGIMSHKLACELNSRIAAIGSMSGTIADLNTCVPSYATPVMHVHGTADGTVPYAGSPLPTLELVQPTIDFWRNAHGCSATADSTQLPDVASDGYTVDRFVYQSCNPQGSVELWRVNGADHEYFYQPVNDFTEAVEIWLFLRQWSHSSPATAGVSSSLNMSFSIYPNPSKSVINIESSSAENGTIVSLAGEELMNLTINSGTNIFDLSQLNPGMYILHTDNPNGLSQRIIIE